MSRPSANIAAADYDATVAAVELQLAKLKGMIEAHKAKAKTDPRIGATWAASSRSSPTSLTFSTSSTKEPRHELSQARI